MDRSHSTSFQQVEDWLRGLGLLQYAQSFYDNGYEDVDTCKEINSEDLDVIGVKSDRDRGDIISAVQKLKLNVYFVLEEVAEKPEIKTFDPIILKSTLKELMTTRNVQLIQPPYYYPDGTMGDLYPLAIQLADELCTHFTDVLDGLEQLRKRQLPAQTYDEMNELANGDEKMRNNTLLDLPEYLNVEMNAKNRGHSFSKYDTRVTKSTTDLTKEINHERSASAPHGQKYKITKGAKADDGKGKSRFGSIFRKDTVKSNKGSMKEPHYDFKADDISMSQTEICDIFSKVKNKEMSQEEVLAAVKKRTSSGEGKHSPNTTLERTHENSQSLGKSKKGAVKISKQMIKRSPSATATFYTSKDDSTPYMIPSGNSGGENNNSLERTRSGSSIGGSSLAGDELHSDSTKSSPEVGKSGIISKIRSSMRKKGKHDSDDSNLSQSGSISSQENIALSDASGSPESRRHDPPQPPVPPMKPSKPPATNVYQHPVPIVSFNKPVPPSKPKKVSGEWEVFQGDTHPPSDSGNTPPQGENIRSDTSLDTTKRLSSTPLQPHHGEGDVGPGRGLILDLTKTKLKPIPIPKAPPRITTNKVSTSSQEDGEKVSTPSTPVAPPRRREPRTPGTPGTPLETLGIDDIGRKMDNLIAGLDSRLNDIEDNYVDDTKLDDFKKTPPAPKPALFSKPLPPSRRPIMPPKRITSDKTSAERTKTDIVTKETVNKNTTTTTTNRKSDGASTFSPLPLKRILWKKLRAEAIRIHETPYTKDGSWNVPHPLVKRYVEELEKSEDVVIKHLDELRQEECHKVKLPFVAYEKKDLDSHQLHETYSLDQWLIFIGLPMFATDLQEVKVTSIEQVNELTDTDFKSIGVYQENHVQYLKAAASKEVKGDKAIIFC